MRGGRRDGPASQGAEEAHARSAHSESSDDEAGCPRSAGNVANFAPNLWDYERQLYGSFYLLRCRALMAKDLPKPPEVAHMKFLAQVAPSGKAAAKANPPAAVRPASTATATPAPATAPAAAVPAAAPSAAAAPGCPATGAASSSLPEVLGLENVEVVPELGRKGAWWRVAHDIPDHLIIRAEVTIFSAEVRRLRPGDWLQQSGPALRLLDARRLVRMPVRPSGWATADARGADGPRYLEPAPRWRVVFSSGGWFGDVLVRAAAGLQSPEVATLNKGDVVEQIAPLDSDGAVKRMHVQIPPSAKGPPAADETGAPLNREGGAHSDVGWVTLDAIAAGGPVFFEPLTPPATGPV